MKYLSSKEREKEEPGHYRALLEKYWGKNDETGHF